MIPFLVFLFFLAGFLLIVHGFGEVREEKSRSVSTRLSQRRQRAERAERSDDLTEQDREMARQEEARAVANRTSSLPVVAKLLSGSSLLNRLDEDLFAARSPWRAVELLAISVVICVAVFILLYWIGFGIFAAVIALLCLFLPWGYVRHLKAKYYRTFEEQLADTLLLMANSLRAGFSFLQSMEMVSRESPAPMCDEFGRVIQEVSVGLPINDALQNLADRINSMDLNLMVTAVVIQREVGGGLAEILETIAEVIRERMRITREIRVLTTQGRWSGAILAFLPISIGILIHLASKVGAPSEPSFIEPLLYDTRGQVLLALAVLNQIIGFFIIMRIVSIRV
jgi:tight adherence protein B